MSASDITITKKTKYILITHGDSYLGQAMAMHIADQLDKGGGQLKTKHRVVRVLCQDKTKLRHLEKRGIEEVDYESQHTIHEQVKVHIKTMIFNPFAATMGRMVERGKNVLDVAIREDVKRIVMISSYGVGAVEASFEESPIDQFNMLESHMHHQLKYGSWVVYRIPFIQQYMYFWSLMFENKNVLGMPISIQDMLISVNANDVLDCVAIASLSKKSMVWAYHEPHRHLQASTILPGGPDGDTSSSSDDNNRQVKAIKRVYELTSEPQTLMMMAEAASQALREAGSGFDVDAVVISDEQLENYLKLVAKSGKDKSFVNSELDRTLGKISKVKDDTKHILREVDDIPSLFSQSNSLIHDVLFKNRGHQDSSDLYPCPADTLTPFCIHLILNHFKVARNSLPPMAPNNDIRDITGRVPMPIDVFFMLNRKLLRSDEYNLTFK
ncbi:hypothetical protein BD408DRAFT_434198 [Parasitella parasitica]|nr:hypothetical protein BD408DRAFT_434198 [Parasitella parasitica]